MTRTFSPASDLPIVVMVRSGTGNVITQTWDSAKYYEGRPKAYARHWENFCPTYAGRLDNDADRTFELYRMPLHEGMSASDYYLNPQTREDVLAKGGHLIRTVTVAIERAGNPGIRPFDRVTFQ